MFEIAQLLQHKTSKYFQASPATKSNWNVSRVARDGIHMMHLWSSWMPEQWSREQNPKRLRWAELVTHWITNTLWISFESLAFLTFHRFHRKSPSCCDFSRVAISPTNCQVITCAIIVINTFTTFFLNNKFESIKLHMKSSAASCTTFHSIAIWNLYCAHTTLNFSRRR